MRTILCGPAPIGSLPGPAARRWWIGLDGARLQLSRRAMPPHHAGVEEFLVVHEGALVAVLDGERFALAAGDARFYPADRRHEFHNPGELTVSFCITIHDRTRR